MDRITAQGLSKRYRLGSFGTYGRLTESLSHSVKRLAGRPEEDVVTREVWALRDVSFTISQGETVGLIGRNGSGKSTLLKILSMVTLPTEGRGRVVGHIGALLEVGTGFHLELTGRENIYLSASIHGMARKDVEGRFDEIVEFSELPGEFLDVPVKRYSSGMFARLGFAVAAHLDPDVLLVDEVLAVGDVGFQRKCLQRIGDLAHEGRAVVLVSHNMSSIRSSCDRVLLLQEGRLSFEGDVEEGVDHYHQEQAQRAATNLDSRTDRRGSGELRLTSVSLRSDKDNVVEVVRSGQPVSLVARYSGERARRGSVSLWLKITSSLGGVVTELQSDLIHPPWKTDGRQGEIICRIPELPLNLGEYTVSCLLFYGKEVVDDISDVLRFTVVAGDFFGSGRAPGERAGVVLVAQDWEHSTG